MQTPRLSFDKVLVTGGTGFVGSHLVPALRQALPATAEIYLGAAAGTKSDLAPVVPFDLIDEGSIRAAVQAIKPDAVIHLAGESSVTGASEAAARTWRINSCGTLEFARCLAAVRPDAAFLFASSAEVYGAAFAGGLVDEKTLPQPLSIYAQSKFAAEQMLASVTPETGTLLVARPSNHIGPAQSTRFALPSFAEQIARGEQHDTVLEIHVGDLSSRRDFLNVRDVVDAYIRLLGHAGLRGGKHVFNISSGEEQTMSSMLDRLRGAAKIRSEVIVDLDRLRGGEQSGRKIDSSRLREVTGWMPQWPLQATLEEILDWQRQQVSPASMVT